jgi:hypothetical protein
MTNIPSSQEKSQELPSLGSFEGEVMSHMHIAPTKAKFNDPVNLFGNQVTTIHNCDMDGRSYMANSDLEATRHNSVWTNSLYLYRDRVLVKTYDHEKGQWMESLERWIKPGKG